MTNNDILRRLRYAFDIDDSKMIALFALADLVVTREQISDWLKKEEDPAYKALTDAPFASFLNGFINDKRGKKDGAQPLPEKRLTNNIIFRKLRIALSLESDGIIDILKLVDYRLSKHELSAFFRKEDHRQYRECKDQILRNFLHGLQLKHRPDATPTKAAPAEKKEATSAPKTTTTAKTTAPAKVKKEASPEYKWQKDRAPSATNTAKKEATTAAKSKTAKPDFKWNADYKPNKARAAKHEAVTSTKQSNKDGKPAFKWKED